MTPDNEPNYEKITELIREAVCGSAIAFVIVYHIIKLSNYIFS